jgi:hypothetical protein
LEFYKRSQLFIRPHNKTLSVVAMRVNNPDCSQFRHQNVTCVTLISAQHRFMRKTFTFPAFRGARKKLGFVLPVDGHNNFRGAKALLRSRRGYNRKLGAVIR